jgi:hypothetical protein
LLGITNGSSMVFPKLLVAERDDWKYNFNDIERHYQVDFNFNITELPPKFITNEWIEKRRIFIHKKFFLNQWEFQIRRSCRKMVDFYATSHMMPFLIDQLNKCDPEKNEYTTAIQDWANIQEIPPQAAYQELKLRQEGYGLVYLRSHALYTKFARKISMSKTMDDVVKNYNEAVATIYTNIS